jgi:hypothetical protein
VWGHCRCVCMSLRVSSRRSQRGERRRGGEEDTHAHKATVGIRNDWDDAMKWTSASSSSLSVYMWRLFFWDKKRESLENREGVFMCVCIYMGSVVIGVG